MDKTKIVIHHTAVNQPSLDKLIASMNSTHKARFNRKKGYEGSEYIQYHFVIGVDGEVRKLAPLKEVLYHASNFKVNQESIGVCLSGNFDKDKPTPAQYGALLKLIWEYNLPISYHRDYSIKSCPGNNFDYKFVNYFASNPTFLDFNKISEIKWGKIRKYFEYKQSKNDCNRYNVVGGLSDLIGRELTESEKKNFLEFSGMFTTLGQGASFLYQLNLITKRWNYNNPAGEVRGYISFNFLKDKNIGKFMQRGYPILFSRIAGADFVKDRNDDGYINGKSFQKKQRHATRFILSDGDILEINNYEGSLHNIFRYENFLEFVKNGNTQNFAVLYSKK